MGLASHRADVAGIVAIGWTDAQGNLVAHSYDGTPPRTNIADMAHFTVQRDHDNVGLYIAPPYRSAASDRWLSAVSRRLNNPDGSFAGIVTAPIDQSYFNQLYRSVDLGKGGSIILLHRAGQILVAPAGRAGSDRQIVCRWSAAQRVSAAGRSGSFEGIRSVDGAARILSYKAVPGLAARHHRDACARRGAGADGTALSTSSAP